MVYLDLNMVMHWPILMHWYYGKHSLVILLMEHRSMIDQFIAAGEQKWNRMNGVVIVIAAWL